MLYAGSSDGSIYAFDLESGDQVWSIDLQTPVEAAPALHDGVLYVGAINGRLFAIREGKILDSMEIGGALVGRPSVSGNRIYVSGDQGRVVGLELKNDHLIVRWSYQVPEGKEGGGVAAPVVTLGDVVIVATDTGGVSVLTE